jgi:hypothetical protein
MDGFLPRFLGWLALENGAPFFRFSRLFELIVV